MSTRPNWPFKITEEEARWLAGGVTRIEHRWEFTSADTSREWLVLSRTVNPIWSKPQEWIEREFPISFLKTGWGAEVEFKPDHRTLVQLNITVLDRIGEIDTFERIHAKERAEFERLKAKFGDR